MLVHLRRRLIFLFTFLTSMIVVIILLAAFLFNLNQSRLHEQETFQNHMDTIVYKLNNDWAVENSWLADMEFSNRLLISIEDNRSQFFFHGSWLPSSQREELIQKAAGQARMEGYDISQFPGQSGEIRSPFFMVKAADGEDYIGGVSILPSDNGYKSLVLLQYCPDRTTDILGLLLLYLLAGLVSITALYIISRLLVGKALEPVVINQQKQKEFIAAASHELRSPLAVIQNSATSLLITPPDTGRFVPRIVKECKRMSGLIHDMLTLASSDANTWTVQTEPLDMNTFLIDLYESYEGICTEKNQQLLLELPDDPLPVLYAGRERLEQLFSILLDNAIFYSPEDSSITIRAFTKKNRLPDSSLPPSCKKLHNGILYMEVSDNGPGIPDSEKKLVFERFYRADRSRNDKNHFGLGLSIARELVLLHKGRIHISDAPSGGAAFLVELPFHTDDLPEAISRE